MPRSRVSFSTQSARTDLASAVRRRSAFVEGKAKKHRALATLKSSDHWIDPFQSSNAEGTSQSLELDDNLFTMRLSLLICGFFVWGSFALAETRTAFVVGNGAYENSAPLENPTNDARLISASLEAVGFEVTTHTDLTRAAFGHALSEFLSEQEDTDVLFFYFAGHGMQLDGENLLLGKDASFQSEFDVMAESIPLSTVAEALRRRAQSVLIFIDACRDNPIAENFYAANFPQARTLDTRGLAEVATPEEGTMFFFAASPGQVAYDGIGRNSPFSLALARHLGTPGLEVLTMTKRVIADVRVLTNGRQSPTVTNDIASEIYFVEEGSSEVVEQRFEDQAASAWEDFRDSTSPDALEAFAEAYPETAYAALALSNASRLRQGGSPEPFGVPSLPDWCLTPRNETEALICEDVEVLELHVELDNLHSARLESVRRGEERGQALIDQREWRLSRDLCGAERNCILQSYRFRLIALGEFGDEAPPAVFVVRSIQEELNRLSCGAGEPDGVIGSRTTRAYTLAVSLNTFLVRDAPLDTVETLARLRSLNTGVCSFIERATDQPGLLEGIWSVEFTECPSGIVESSSLRFRLRHDGDGIYSGWMAYGRDGGFSRVIGGRLTESALTLVHVTPVGARQVFSLEPGDQPDVFVGFDHNRCGLRATR